MFNMEEPGSKEIYYIIDSVEYNNLYYYYENMFSKDTQNTQDHSSFIKEKMGHILTPQISDEYKKLPYLLQQIVSNDFSYLDFFNFVITDIKDYNLKAWDFEEYKKL